MMCLIMKNATETVMCVECNTQISKYDMGNHVKLHGYQNLSEYKKFYDIDQKKPKLCEQCHVSFMPLKKSKRFCTL